MMEADTSPDLETALPDIMEQPEDTPNSVEQEQQTSSRRSIALTLSSIMITPLLAIAADPFAATHDMTRFTEEERTIAPFSETSIPQHVSAEAVDDVHNRTRLELLARQYVSGELSPEEEARLAIVSERVRRLIPRVTTEDFEMLERILEDANQIEAEDIERRRRLGIE
jgi:phage gp29-like protein